MATNSTTRNQTTENPARKLITYDLVIGILAFFRLFSSFLSFWKCRYVDKRCPKRIRSLPLLSFLFDFFRSLRLAPNKWGYFLKGGGWLDLLGGIPFYAFAIFRVARLFLFVRQLRRMTGGDLRRILVILIRILW